MPGLWAVNPELRIGPKWSVCEELEQLLRRSRKTKPAATISSLWLQFAPGSSGTRRDEQRPDARRAEQRARCSRSNPDMSAWVRRIIGWMVEQVLQRMSARRRAWLLPQ